jgi:toxin-antitoxin system PIN domain toxin
MTSSAFPDLNVWVALTLRIHEHHAAAWKWYRGLSETTDLVFCRFTQLGFLRLMTTQSVAGAYVLSQRQAWAAYDRWIVDSDCIFEDEPFGLEVEFRAFSDRIKPHPKEWADSYLAAFAAAKSMELVTFDKALAERARRSILLKASPE